MQDDLLWFFRCDGCHLNNKVRLITLVLLVAHATIYSNYKFGRVAADDRSIVFWVNISVVLLK